MGRRGLGLAALVREAAGEVEAAGTPAVAHLMAGAVRDIAALATRPPSPSEAAHLQVFRSLHHCPCPCPRRPQLQFDCTSVPQVSSFCCCKHLCAVEKEHAPG